MNRWSEEEIAFLKKHYGTMARQDIAERLNKSLGGVDWKITSMGLAAKPVKKHNSLLTRRWV